MSRFAQKWLFLGKYWANFSAQWPEKTLVGCFEIALPVFLTQVEECEIPKSPREKEIIDDLCVRRETILKLFDPPPSKATFFRWVEQGTIVKARGLNGYYLLNATRVRLSMNPVDIKAAPEGLGNS